MMHLGFGMNLEIQNILKDFVISQENLQMEKHA